MRSVRLPAFAKVNLGLHILGKRPDGYHELRTVFQTISLHDKIILSPQRRPGVELIVSGDPALAAASDAENLAYRAVDALRNEFRIRSGVRIELGKRIPIGRGLGGGSSDAAAALVGMLRLTGRTLPAARLAEIAASLGADVPFFLYGGRALGVSRGDEIYPLPDLPARAVLVVSPLDIVVSTRDAYAWYDRGRQSRQLTNRDPASKLWRFCALCWSPQGDLPANDFEAAVFRRDPRLGKLKRELLKPGAAGSAPAGGGVCGVGTFRKPTHARPAPPGCSGEHALCCPTPSPGA